MASTQIKIGNYTPLQTIGSGTFGKVKLAVHSQTGAKVAMKIVNRLKVTNLDMATRLKREIQYLKLLRHPHIIKLYEVISTTTDIILVMEYAGGELFNYIVEKGRIAEPEARRLFQQIIAAVEHCHRHKIVHRDLKPENVLMDDHLNIKIADFGLSNFMNDGDFLRTSCGSPNYAAPEVISGKLYSGEEIDIWSCGVILYVMLCGRLPFDDEYVPNLFKKINGGVYSIPSFVSPGAKSLIASMLVVDPLKRISIQEIRKNPWFSKDLPDYLSPLPQKSVIELDRIDDTIVHELEKKMGFSSKTIQHALHEKENNQIKVAYQLVVDHRQINGSMNNLKEFLSSSPPAWNAIPEKKPTTIQVLSSSLPAGGISETGLDPRKSKIRSRWHYGIRSKSHPLDIMLEIYRALQGVGMKWKVLSTFRIRVLYTTVRGSSLKFEVQLYRMDQENFLVDFKAIPHNNDINCFAFFDACTRLITELAVSS